MKKSVLFILTALCVSFAANATVWRVNNNANTDPDFSNFSSAVSNASVMAGDTLYIEPSASSYGSQSLNKSLVVIGNGYYLDTAGSASGNPGLQENVNSSDFIYIRLQGGSEGSTFIGIRFTSTQYLDPSLSSTNTNITFEKCAFASDISIWTGSPTFDNIIIKKCLFYGTGNNDLFDNSSVTLTNFTVENCIFRGHVESNPNSASTSLIFRNNVADYLQLTGYYVANSIMINNTNSTLNSCVVRNNLFVTNQSGVTVGPLSTNGNNLIGQTITSLIENTGSIDGLFQLAAGSPAIGGGVDIGGQKPDCGPFGGNDPYILSGIPNIPTIYSLDFPNGNSVPSGSSTILVDFNARGNN